MRFIPNFIGVMMFLIIRLKNQVYNSETCKTLMLR
ncbi:hypothetical protein LS68_006985 [Helicobacter sp. MIT 05-5293]|nr:hypothetical protein LS68_006985 [Helicobacter sp. MIT 05-5293]